MRRRGLRGLRGERGERGSTGERGGERGPVGKKGESGERGPRGSGAGSRQVRLSFVAVVIASVVLLSVFSYQVRELRHLAGQNRARASEGQRALAGLCALKHDIQVRIAGAHAFLAEHPDGIPGIPASTIQQSVKNQEATLRALADLRCGARG